MQILYPGQCFAQVVSSGASLTDSRVSNENCKYSLRFLWPGYGLVLVGGMGPDLDLDLQPPRPEIIENHRSETIGGTTSHAVCVSRLITSPTRLITS